ncbi:hypothetical protein SLEP1_g17486 [Rubroshorea leprosula]|uniref:Uncharacterized protein n=1 Tax=Rubroshorea leprosula TaxID=152421 RepID=A0AAV5IUJ8_9ROSI|nr:hypothetical protein SLEP1_g17486 [Rubroshorea leprosula]
MFEQLIENPNFNIALILIAEALHDADYIKAHGKGKFTCFTTFVTPQNPNPRRDRRRALVRRVP